MEKLYFEEAKNKNTFRAYSDYLKNYPKGKYAAEALSRYEELYFQWAKEKDTIKSYNNYLKNYPNGKYAAEAHSLLQKLYFQWAEENNTIEAYKWFLKYYKHRISELKIDESRFLKAVSQDTIKSYENFIKEYPDNRFVKVAEKRKKDLKKVLMDIKKLFETDPDLLGVNENIKYENILLIKSLSDKGSIGIEALVSILTDESLSKTFYFEAIETLYEATGRSVIDFMSSRGLVRHFGHWVRPEKKKQLLAELRKSRKSDIDPNIKSSQGVDWKISVLSIKIENRLPMLLDPPEIVRSRDGITYFDVKPPIDFGPSWGHILLLLKIRAENLDDNKLTIANSNSFMVVDKNRKYFPTGLSCPWFFPLKSTNRYLKLPGGVNIFNENIAVVYGNIFDLIFVYNIKKGTTGLKLCAMDAPLISLDELLENKNI